jgi:D-alanine-D-alanine ligase
MATRVRVGLLFGGRSAEHDVSKLSAANVLSALDPSRYEVVPIGIARDGRWRLVDGAVPGAALPPIPESGPEVALIPGRRGRLAVVDGDAGAKRRDLARLDVVFPILHGPNGEDGTVQGSLELADVAYVGSGVLGCAASMDKDVAKRLMREAGLPIVPFVPLRSDRPGTYDEAVAALGSGDLFVKPANMGSSVGVARARSRDEFARACEDAFRYDRKLLVERAVVGAREIECSVLENAAGEIKASPLGEIAPAESHGFYSYDAKYVDAGGAALRIPADLAPERAKHIQALAVKTFEVLCCEGLARVDFFVDPGAGLEGDAGLYVNEANALPGFTSISMYPKLWEAAGLKASDLMDILVDHALARHRRRPAAT